MIKKYKNYLLGVIGILLALTMLVGVKYLMKPKYEELPEVKLRNINNKKSFAIMIQTDNGYEEYTSTDNTWPGDEYVYKEAKCTDNNGALVDDAISFENGKATLTTNQTIYCTLYFDEKPKNLEKLRYEDTQGYLSEELQGGMYRYQAAPANETEAAQMTNWICFGTKSKDDCTNPETGIDKYMYRIIGITEEGQMYLIKETFVKEGSVTGFSWDDVTNISGSGGDACPDGKCPEWNEADLFQRINGTANGTKAGKGDNNDSVDDNTDIFVDSTQYDYLKSGDEYNGGEASEWYNLIADHEWLYGDTTTGVSDTATYTGDTVYAIETGKENTKHYVGTDGSNEEQTYTWSNKVKAKISLMYIHDYVYSYYDGSTEESRGNPKNYSTAKNGWLFFQKDGYNTSTIYEWLSTRWGVASASSTFVFARPVYDGGYVGYDSLYVAGGVRPVFYLSSKAKIIDGDGTKANPYILSLN